MPLDLNDPEHPKAGVPEVFLKGNAPLLNPSFSPDGRWIAYTSGETQPSQIFVRPFVAGSSGVGGKWQVSTEGANQAVWSRTGNELIYSAPNGASVVTYTTTGDSFVASPSQRLPQFANNSLAGPADIMPDGKQFVVVTVGSEVATRETRVKFLLNFADELRRRSAPGAVRQ